MDGIYVQLIYKFYTDYNQTSKESDVKRNKVESTRQGNKFGVCVYACVYYRYVLYIYIEEKKYIYSNMYNNVCFFPTEHVPGDKFQALVREATSHPYSFGDFDEDVCNLLT